MEELLMGIYTSDRTKHLNVITSICILNLINTCCLTFSQPSAAECILQLGKFSVPYNVRDEGGNWGSFLNDETCGGPFRDYLYAMGIRANKTGQMYMNLTQQTNCLTKMNDEGNGIDVFGCGIEKLTKTGGSCSDFSVNDANIKLGDKLRKLSYNCQFQDTADKRGHLCESCVNSWKDIKEMKSKHDKYTEAGSDICRFAVLVSLTSTRITDQAWLRKLYNCLSNQKQPVNFAHTEEKEQEEEEHSELTGKHKFRPVLSVLIGGILAVLITVFISVWAFIRKRANVDASEKKFAIDLPKDSSLEVSIEEVYSATNNLNESNFIGEGTAGRVYRGVLPNNQQVAIKHITHEECIETFLREVKSLTNVRHPNLVALLGYSKNAKECFLIYEICPYGNLSQWLFANNRVLSWTQRLEIAIDSAKGLLFLHTYHDRSIIHRDIKPTNILLGQNFEAKLSDFGLSKVIDIDESYMISEVRGTYGYVDPEYETNHHVNSAGDVYSFGIVLLQILSGRKVINMNMEKPTRLDKIAKSLLRERRAVDFVDPKLHGDYSTDSFQLTLELAISCIAPKQQRPSIENVVDKLEEALAITRREKASTPHSTPVWSSTSFQEQYRTIVENVT